MPAVAHTAAAYHVVLDITNLEIIAGRARQLVLPPARKIRVLLVTRVTLKAHTPAAHVEII